MSTTIKTPKRQTMQQRVKAATAQLQGLISAEDVKSLNAAVTLAAAAEAMHNAAFRVSVRRIYEELSTQSASSKSTPQLREHSATELVPLPGTEGARFDPFAPLDPYALLRLYGSQQLRAALTGYSYAALREAEAIVRQKLPGTKPTDARKTESLIDYIVQQLTEAR